MPELKSENPTNEELKNYLDEHWLEQSRSKQRFLNDFQIDFSHTYEIFHDSILKSLIRLNEFSRENKFWHNTNKKPTVYKLDEFCKLILQENANDILALRTLLALSMIYGHVEKRFSKIIEKLVTSEHLSVETLVEIYLVTDLTYDDNGEHFAKILFNLELIDKAMPKLVLLSSSKNYFVSTWSKTVLDKITS